MASTGKTPEHYQVEDFVTDETFINYFFHLDAADLAFWEKWILANPDCNQSIDAAKELLRSLTLTLTAEEIKAETAKLQTAIGFEEALCR